MSQFDFLDNSILDPKQLASLLKSSFDEYYKTQEALLERKEKDLKVLKRRAGIKEDNVPETTKNIVDVLYDKLIGTS